MCVFFSHLTKGNSADMRMFQWYLTFGMVLLLAATVPGGCGPKDGPADRVETTLSEELGPTIGSLAAVAPPQPLAVEGYGLVGGLAGTGSPACPPEIRAYLRQYILVQVSSGSVSPDDLINSRNTAVVRLEGRTPPAAFRGDRFDVRVSPIAGSDTTSLHGGWLYKADLKSAGTFGASSRTLAEVEGPVFINRIGVAEPDLTTGYILGGATALYDYVGALQLRRSDFAMASAIRNRLNERYGPGTSQAVSPTEVGFVIPAEYHDRRERFIAMVMLTFLTHSPELTQMRSNVLRERLLESSDKETSEIALEAMGREVLPALRPLLDAPDAEVRLRAARCALNLREYEAIGTLRAIALDETSPYRAKALEAMVVGARRNDAALLARRLLRDRDTEILLAAYEALRRMDDIAVRKEPVGRSFYLEQVVQTDRRAIFVSRSGQPRVTVFGAPLTCGDDIFVEAADQTVVVNSRAGQNYVSVTRKDPGKAGVIGPVRTGFTVSEIVRALGAERQRTPAGRLVGLATPYSDVTAVMKQMSEKDAVDAEFWAGPLPKIARIVKK